MADPILESYLKTWWNHSLVTAFVANFTNLNFASKQLQVCFSLAAVKLHVLLRIQQQVTTDKE